MIMKIIANNFLLLLIFIIFINLFIEKYRNRNKEYIFTKKSRKKAKKGISKAAKDTKKGMEKAADVVHDEVLRPTYEFAEPIIIKPIAQFTNKAVKVLKNTAIKAVKGSRILVDPEYERKLKEKEEREKRKKRLQEWLADYEERYNNLLEARNLTMNERNEKRLELERKKNDYTNEVEVLDSYILDNNMLYNKQYTNNLICSYCNQIHMENFCYK